jgi:hypothetical protein
MTQHDYVIANQGAVDFRNDINNALLSIVSQNAGASAPTATFADMIWYDTTNDLLKMRNEADDAWITLFKLDQTGDLINYLDLIPQTDNTENLGTSAKAWKDLFLQGNVYFDNDNSRTQKHYLWTPISSASASSSSSIDIALPSGWDIFLIRFEEVYPSTDNKGMLFRTSQDGGSTFDNGSGNYVYGNMKNATTFSTVAVNNSTSSTSIRLNDQIGNTQLEAAHGEMLIYGANSAASPTRIQCYTNFDEAATTNKVRTEQTMGRRANSAHITNYCRFLMASGNIAGGKFVLYGRNLI